MQKDVVIVVSNKLIWIDRSIARVCVCVCVCERKKKRVKKAGKDTYDDGELMKSADDCCCWLSCLGGGLGAGWLDGYVRT